MDAKSKNESLLKNSIDRAMAVKLYRMQCDREVPISRFCLFSIRNWVEIG